MAVLLVLGVPCALAPGTTAAQLGTVKAELRISKGEGNFGGALGQTDNFGRSTAALGDLDGDGVGDLAVGTTGVALDQGALWILFLNPDGTVKARRRIQEGGAGFGGDLRPQDFFGYSCAALGDLDGDGVVDLAVGAPGDDDGGDSLGSVWILFLNTDGTVKAEQRISATSGGFGGELFPFELFASGLASPGDLDGDGIPELAVGNSGAEDHRGALWILFLDADGTVKSEQKISATAGGFGGQLDAFSVFGFDLGSLGDFDGDGLGDLVVGSPGDGDGGFGSGAVWILLLNADGTVKHEQKLSATSGGFPGHLAGASFGSSVTALADLDGDGVVELGVGASHTYGTDYGQGAVWIVFLNADGTAKAARKIDATAGGFEGVLYQDDQFGSGVASLGDLDGDGIGDLAVGTESYDAGLFPGNVGAVWILFLSGPCFALDFEREDDLVTPLVNGQHLDTEFGSLVTLSSSGANAGLAIFDSTVGGPNDPSQDRDLLVGSGNLLVLQTENHPPDANDVFPRPNDDDDGGTIRLDFVFPVEPRSLRLVDLDAGDGPSEVVLLDGSGRQRTYLVPGNWTGDRLLSQPGEGTLDLSTLSAQPGFASTATAAETPGFDATDVVRLEVRLDGSGGIDDLALCSSNLPRASVTARNGSGVNPANLQAITLPILGRTWRARLDCSAHGTGLAALAWRPWPTAGGASPAGEILIAGGLLHRAVAGFAGAASAFAVAVPRDLSLLGLQVHVQGQCQRSAAGPSGPRTFQVQAYLSNALDLVLGF